MTKPDVDRLYSYDLNGICRIKIWTAKNILLLMEQGGNRGMSVTNASERLATKICNEYNLDKTTVQVFETYSYHVPLTYDRITYTIEYEKFRNPTWEPFGNQKKFELYIDK